MRNGKNTKHTKNDTHPLPHPTKEGDMHRFIFFLMFIQSQRKDDIVYE